MKLGNVIARGRTAELYSLPDNQVLKLFYEWVSAESVEKEYNLSLLVYQAGIPVPQVFDLVSHENRSGIVFENIHGTTMLVLLIRKPWQVAQHSRTLAKLHNRIHQIRLEGFPPYREHWLHNIKRVPNLSDHSKDLLIREVGQLPDDRILCHFDFHPDQVIYTARGPVILDWMTASAGHPAADIARTQILMTIGKPPDANFGMNLLATLLGKLANFYYQKHYLELNPNLSQETIKKWLAPLAAVRLLEKVPGEESSLMKIITKSLRS